MSLYQLGMTNPTLPGLLDPVVEAVREVVGKIGGVRSGIALVKVAEDRFYKAGVYGVTPAQSEDHVERIADLVTDVSAVISLGLGVFAVANAFPKQGL